MLYMNVLIILELFQPISLFIYFVICTISDFKEFNFLSNEKLLALYIFVLNFFIKHNSYYVEHL